MSGFTLCSVVQSLKTLPYPFGILTAFSIGESCEICAAEASTSDSL
jgi:hypothetical protein